MRTMLDIKLIRENPDLVKTNLAKRGNPENLQMLDELVAVDRQWRLNLTKLNELRHQRKQVTIEIAKLKKSGGDTSSQVEKARLVDAEVTGIEKQVTEEEQKTHDYLMKLPNLLDESVPFGKDEKENVQVKTWGEITKFSFPVKNHIDLALDLDLIDMERAGKISGSRFFFLKNQLALLDMALLNFAIHELTKKGYTPIEPPLLMKREAYEGVTALGDFADVLY
ncbi:serine--tRNA ligase, partial [Candidatus Bathyarchaeota archaeon]|nr:serine--tRNA ligase [Candidatus Bathyarchaeota archaeon]